MNQKTFKELALYSMFISVGGQDIYIKISQTAMKFVGKVIYNKAYLEPNEVKEEKADPDQLVEEIDLKPVFSGTDIPKTYN